MQEEVVVSKKTTSAKIVSDSRQTNQKNKNLRKAIIKYLINLSIALIGALFSFFLQKVFGFSL